MEISETQPGLVESFFSWPSPAWLLHILGYIRGTARERPTPAASHAQGGQGEGGGEGRERGDREGTQTESESGTERQNRRELEKGDKTGCRL